MAKIARSYALLDRGSLVTTSWAASDRQTPESPKDQGFHERPEFCSQDYTDARSRRDDDGYDGGSEDVDGAWSGYGH